MVKGSARVVTYAIVRYSEPPGHVWVWVCIVLYVCTVCACIVLYVCTVCACIVLYVCTVCACIVLYVCTVCACIVLYVCTVCACIVLYVCTVCACIVLYVCTVCVYVHIVRYSDPQCICGYVQYCIKYGRKFWQGMFLADWQV